MFGNYFLLLIQRGYRLEYFFNTKTDTNIIEPQHEQASLPHYDTNIDPFVFLTQNRKLVEGSDSG